MKSVLISIQPKWCEKIASGEKTIEVRKTKPKLEPPFKVYIYCTKDNTFAEKTLRGFDNNGKAVYYKANKGKVIGEFVCRGLTYIEAGYDTNGNKHIYNTAFLEHRMCIPENELHAYLYKSRENCGGWAWHISDVVMYHGLPKELSEFHVPGYNAMKDMDFIFSENEKYWQIKRPPQSWCYVEEG